MQIDRRESLARCWAARRAWLALALLPLACSGAAQPKDVAALPLAPLVPTPTAGPVYRVPTSIPRDCSRDAGGDLMRFIASVPRMSTVLFPTGGCYAAATSIVLSDRTGLTIDGAGSSFRKTSPSIRGETGADSRPNWRIAGGSDITFQNMVIEGVYRNVPNSPNQFDPGISIWGAQRVTLRNLSIGSVDGDLVTAEPDSRSGAPLAAATPSRDIIIDGLLGVHAARQGIALTSTVGAAVTGSFIDDVQNAVDLEPDVPGEPMRNIRIEGNRFGALAFTAVAAVPGTSPDVGNVTIARNRMTVPPKACYPAIAVGGDSAAPSPLRKDGYTVRENTLLSRVDGVLLNGVASGAVSNNQIMAMGAGNGCPAAQGAVPIRLVNSNVAQSGNAGLGFR